MPTSDIPDTQVPYIRDYFAELVGKSLLKYETAELRLREGIWDPWNDLPIRLFVGEGDPTAVAWSHFSRLWIERGTALPFSTEGSEVRWVENVIPALGQLIGSELRSVLLGRGQMSIEGHEIEIWTRLLLVFEAGWLEIFNALDENGYAFHSEQPIGEFIKCI
jgi:hypothetical protein